MSKMRVPGTAGMDGKLKRLKKYKPPQNPSIKGGGQHTFEWGEDDHRKDDLNQLPKGTQAP
ncbi:MAG TPA: hypothetical protein VEP90_29080, partial [Methylomirabilota bacterium]|nr:hypothetical protein [Methylomirabilota bacterium]